MSQIKRKQMRYYLLVVILGFYSLKGYSQQPLSLSEAISMALENNYDIKIFSQNEDIATLRNNWGTAGRYPVINFLAGLDNTQNFEAEKMNNRLSAGVSLNWTLFDGYAVQIGKQKLEELENLSRGNTTIMVEGTIQAVILAYYSALLAQEQLKVFEEVMNLSQDRYGREKQRKELGAAVSYSVLQAQNAFLDDKAGYLSQEVNYKNALRNLNLLMAQKENVNYQLTEPFEVIPASFSLDDLTNKMLAENSVLKNQYINQVLLEKEIALAKSSFFPTISLGTGVNAVKNMVNFTTNNQIPNQPYSYYGNITLSYNLFSGGNRKRAAQIAEIDKETGLIEIDQVKHEMNNQLTNLYELFLVRKALLSIADENLEAARLNLQISEEKFRAGAINSFNYRDVQLIFLNASLSRLKAIYDYLDNHTSLMRLTGGIIREYQ